MRAQMGKLHSLTRWWNLEASYHMISQVWWGVDWSCIVSSWYWRQYLIAIGTCFSQVNPKGMASIMHIKVFFHGVDTHHMIIHTHIYSCKEVWNLRNQCLVRYNQFIYMTTKFNIVSLWHEVNSLMLFTYIIDAVTLPYLPFHIIGMEAMSYSIHGKHFFNTLMSIKEYRINNI